MNNETLTPQPEPNHSPKTIRRDRRAAVRNIDQKNNEGSSKNSHSIQMLPGWNDQAIYYPRHKKLKGYEKEAKRRQKK